VYKRYSKRDKDFGKKVEAMKLLLSVPEKMKTDYVISKEEKKKIMSFEGYILSKKNGDISHN